MNDLLGSIHVEQIIISDRLQKLEASSTSTSVNNGVKKAISVVNIEDEDVTECSDEEQNLRVVGENIQKILHSLCRDEPDLTSIHSRNMEGNLVPVTPSKSQTKDSTSKPIELTKDERGIYNYIFADDRSDREIISSCKGQYVTRADMKYISPGMKLRDVIVSMVSTILTEEEHKRTDNKASVWYLPTQKLSASSCNKAIRETWKNSKYFQNYMDSLSTCDVIYIPILAGDHYILARVMKETKTVDVWDSLASSDDPLYNKGGIKEILSSLDLFLEEEIRKLKNARFNFSTFSIKRRRNVPRQENTFDCGIFIILFMQGRCDQFESHSFNFDSEFKRSKLVVWIATLKHNAVETKLRNHITMNLRKEFTSDG